MLTILSVVITAGLLFTAVSCQLNSFTGMIVGRGIYGVGGDSITSSQWALILDYFQTHEIGIANVLLF